MKTTYRRVAALAVTTALALTGCTGEEYEQRKQEQKNSAVIQGQSLEQKNLRELAKRENDPSNVGYVYIVSYGSVIGYYVIKGKVSSSGSQIGPEQEVICKGTSYESCHVLDSKQDDNTYGDGDPGKFFFLADGTMVQTDLPIIYSDQPLTIDVPRLQK